MTAAFYAPTAAAQTDPQLAEVQKLIKQGQYPQALEKTDAYIAGRPKEVQGRFLRGVILAEMNRSADAITVFSRLTEEYPELPEPYNNLAVLYAQQRQYDKARNALEMAIRTHPSYAIAHENLGDVYSKLASQAYDKALQLDTANAGAQTKLSLIRELISISARQSGKPAAGPRLPLVESPRMGGADFAANTRRPLSPAAPPAATPARPVAPLVAKPAVPGTPTVVAAAPVVPVAPHPPAAPAVAPRPPVAPAAPVNAPATPVTASAPKAPVAAPATAVAPAAVANKAPTPPVVTTPANNSEEVAKALQDWAAAWSRKDVKGYLARYAGNFDPPGGVSRKEWANERQVRINKPGKIEVEVRNIQVSYEGADKAVVRFRQHYRSANLKTQATKTIVFVRSGGKWLILQERVS